MPVISAEKESNDCSNCEYGKTSRASDTGFQCGAEKALSCKPFLLDQPKYWQEINYNV